MSISFTGGTIAIAIQTSAGHVHTTTFYTIPVTYLLIPITSVAIVTFFIWFGSRGRERSN